MRETSIITVHGHDFDCMMRSVAERVTGWDVDHSTHVIAPGNGEHFVTVFASRELHPPPVPPVCEVDPGDMPSGARKRPIPWNMGQ